MYYVVMEVQILSFYLIFLTMTKIKFQTWERYLYGFVTVVTGILFTSFLNVWGAAAIGIWFLVISYFKNSGRLYLWDCFCAVYALVMNTFIGYFIWDIIMFLVQILFKTSLSSTEYLGYFITALAPPAINWIIVSFVRKQLKKRHFPGTETIRRPIIILCVLGMGAVTTLLYPILAFGNKYGGINKTQKLLITILWIVLICTLAFFVIQYVRTLNKHMQELRKKQIEDLLAYSVHLEQLYDELRGFRHDYANLLSTLEYSIYSGNMEDVKQIFETVIQPAGTAASDSKYDFAKLSNIKVTEIKSLIAGKLIVASQKKLNVRFEAEHPFHFLHMDTSSFIRILAILLDNAIEAAELSPEKTLSAALYEDETRQIFDIRNSYSGNIDLKKIQQKDFSTKFEGRGLGLFNIKEMLAQEKHVILSTEIENNIFIQKLLIHKHSE